MYVSFKHILFHMHEEGLVVCCMFDCIPPGTYFILQTMQLESLIIQPAFIIYPI